MKIFSFIKGFLLKMFSISNYGETHYILYILGIKIKFPKLEYAIKKKQSPYYYYKKNNIDITTLPPAEGQVRDIQLANLALLKEMDYVCKQAGLKYWLDGGTQIGVVRHKGFVPWDDDIDTGMLREDYNRIIEAFEKYSRNSDIFAGYVRLPKSTCQQIIKIQHKKCPYLFVDIFPFDIFGPKREPEAQVEDTLRMKQYRKELESSCRNNTSNEEVSQRINEYMETKVLVNQIPENKNDAELVWGLDFNHTWKNWFTNYDVIFPLKPVLFEGYEFDCINNPDAFLSRLYGNYMAYPKKITMGHSMFLKLSKEENEVIKNLIKGL